MKESVLSSGLKTFSPFILLEVPYYSEKYVPTPPTRPCKEHKFIMERKNMKTKTETKKPLGIPQATPIRKGRREEAAEEAEAEE